MSTRTGISNRRPAEEEERERQEFPPQPSPPVSADERGDAADAPSSVNPGQPAHTAGSRSTARKEDGSKYADRPMPQTQPVQGAFGKEK